MVTFFFVEKSEIKTKNGTQRVTLNSSVQILLDMTVRKKTDLMIKKNILLDCNSSKFNNKNCSSKIVRKNVSKFICSKKKSLQVESRLGETGGGGTKERDVN